MTSVLVPRGFRFSATAAGIKNDGLDLGLIVSEPPATACAVFTKNTFPAAPILVSKENLKESRHTVRAVLVNSGNANAATGERGMASARLCVEQLAESMGCPAREILVSSTGVIGRPFPAEKICAAIPALLEHLSADNTEAFARSIMTTDTKPKIAFAEVGGAHILGFAKGAGMIHPDMATMLVFIVTDIAMSYPDLVSVLRRAVDQSFHSITVDGDTSTNDTVMVLANGASNVSPDIETFRAALTGVCQDLAKAIVRDGEGASKFVELIIEGAPTDDAARQIGRTIARSPLVKTAIYGRDPNWGRIVAAIGNSGVVLQSDRVDLYVDDIPFSNLDAARARLAATDIPIRVVLHSGNGKATVWTCDFTEEYIHINADYTS